MFKIANECKQLDWCPYILKLVIHVVGACFDESNFDVKENVILTLRACRIMYFLQLFTSCIRVTFPSTLLLLCFSNLLISNEVRIMAKYDFAIVSPFRRSFGIKIVVDVILDIRTYLIATLTRS